MVSESRDSIRRNFSKIQSFDTEYSPVTVTQYESIKTGLRVVVVDQEGPKVNGYFTLATEIHDDSGAPHTLEHLCFLGSKTFPYKGMLDKLATRAYSNTNAWTATDHTAYTLDSAGWEGFAQVLPIYLEHLILPTLTDAGCYTEVHHLDGSGNDAGVVYSEMQGFESNLEYLMHWKYKRMLYPEGVGFRYETGGRIQQIRILTPAQIRDFHRQMYQPKNLCLVITGAVDHANLLDILDRFEATIVDEIPKPDAPFKRPWIDSKQAACLETSLSETLEFPDDDESFGEISINFFGPEFNDSLLCGALSVLLTYLAGSSASVLDNTLVEKEQLASAVTYDTELRPLVVIRFFLSSVATEKLELTSARFFEVLRETAAKPVDLDHMRDCVKRERRRVKFEAESSSEYFADPIIKDFLFGHRDGSSLRADLENLKDFDILATWDDNEWRRWLRSWLAEAPHATILAKPSAKLSRQLKSEEKARVSAQKKELGSDGLKQLEERLAAARAENDAEIPAGLLERFQVPSPKSIRFINTITGGSGTARRTEVSDNPIQRLVNQDTDLPNLFVHFEHVQSNFASVTLMLGTAVIPLVLRPMLAIYMENFFSTPIMRNGKIIDFEQVVIELEKDAVGYDIGSGQSMGNSEMLVIQLQVEVEKYETAIRWLRELLFSPVFNVERIKATITRMLASIQEEKRDGEDMMSNIELMVGTDASSIGRACSTLTRALYLRRIRKLLEHDPEVILKDLMDINTALRQTSNLRILVTANVERLQHPVSSWKTLIGGLHDKEPLKPLDTRLSWLSEVGKNPGNTTYITPLPTIDSSYALAVSKGPYSWQDPVLPALMVATSYLNAVEGPLWTGIRGSGLAYHSGFYQHVDSGQISLTIGSSPDASKAFVASKEVVEKIVSGTTPIDPLMLEGAVSSIVLSFANADATMAAAAQSSFVRQVMRGLPKDYPSIILEKVRQVTAEEAKTVMKGVFLPLFDSATSNLFVTCAPIIGEQIVAGLTEIGFKSDVKPLAYFQDDYGLKVGEESNDEHEDDDSDMDGEDEDESEEEDEDPDAEGEE